ncbi:hypothetical protein PILCRDRAFT_822639 [Piloderma croceum F 1598]|uniref:HMG box domain-containing protein n=1 Tax=Piloderma croceum (strain F 1598) TaxID=765440 RepID=A0A0C3F6A1_PILCF|nr:hypothetical protein PILCRDRAFT_822639 [Piloderma croceum F 1598]
MLTLLTQRISYRLGTSSAVRGVARASVTTTPIALPSLTRRTFLTGTPRLSFAGTAAAATKPSAKRTTAGAGAKTGTKKAAASKAKESKPNKKVVKEPVVQEAKKPAHLKLTKADMPPTHPPNAWVLFFTKYIKGVTQPIVGIRGIPNLLKEAAALWNNMSDVEKQPYKDEVATLKAAFEIKRQSYFDSVPAGTLTEINRRRKDKGLPMVHKLVREEDRRPQTSFLRYLEDFRTTPDGQALFASSKGARSWITSSAVTAGQQWKAMTEAQKAPYVEAAHKDFAAWKAKKTPDA